MMPAAGQPRRLEIAACILLAVGGGFLGWRLCGHFVKPHADFFEFWETGEALLSVEVPPTTRRAPLFPLLIALGGRLLAAFGVADAPGLRAAECLNAILLPANAVLTALLLRRHLGSLGILAGVWLLCLPLTFYCTAHALVEPLLLALLTATLLAFPARPRLAYALAGLAALARLDALGALAGVFLLDWLLQRTPLRRALLRAAPAAAPLMAWTIFTAATWPQSSAEHYLTQVADRPALDPDRTFATMHLAVFERLRLQTSFWLEWLADLPRVLSVILACLAFIGVGVHVKLRNPAVLLGVAIAGTYFVIHAVFPFQFARFGYPTVSIWLLFIGLGMQIAAASFREWARSLTLFAALSTLLLAPLAALALDQFTAFPFVRTRPYAWAAFVPWAVALAMIFTYALCWVASALAALSRNPSKQAPAPPVAAPARPSLRTLASSALLHAAFALLLLILALAHARSGCLLIGSGRDMAGIMETARWMRDHAGPEDRVLSGLTGPLQLVCGRDRTNRFLSFGDIRAETWPEIVADLREQRVRYVLWYDEIFAEVGPHYAERWRLERFDLLSTDDVAGAVLVETVGRTPAVRIWRVPN